MDAYEVMAGMVCLQCKNCNNNAASEVSFLQWCAKEISLR